MVHEKIQMEAAYISDFVGTESFADARLQLCEISFQVYRQDRGDRSKRSRKYSTGTRRIRLVERNNHEHGVEPSVEKIRTGEVNAWRLEIRKLEEPGRPGWAGGGRAEDLTSLFCRDCY